MADLAQEEKAAELRKQKRRDEWHWEEAKKYKTGLPRLTATYDFEDMKRRFKPDRYGKLAVRDNDGIIPKEEVDQWSAAYKRPDVQRVRVDVPERNWPSRQPAEFRARQQRGAIWAYLVSLHQDLPSIGYKPEEVQKAADNLAVKFASGESDDEDIIDGEDPLHPDGPVPLESYLYQVPTINDSSGLIDDDAVVDNETNPMVD